MTSIIKAAENRHAVKAYDPSRRLSDDHVEEIRKILQLSPSSINIQPWHFIMASSAPAKARIAKAAYGNFAYNAPSIQNASLAILYCCKTEIGEADVAKIVAQEAKDGRYLNDEMHAKRHAMMNSYIKARNDAGTAPAWMLNQVYINLGFLLMGAAALGVDATPMEGVDTAMLDAEFDLAARGLCACFVVTLGYLDTEKDYNNTLPKSRLPLEVILEEI